ncbi:MAG: hypothetical protein HGA96_16975 [Desulfobulbaceae bacterium]|nr:hypothetical protein [Desulfobulbaceae bacterium]
MASRYYCSNVAEELEMWSDRLHKLSGEIDAIPTGMKQRMFSQVEELHIIMTELDDRLCELMDSCATAESGDTVSVSGGVPGYGPALGSRGNELFDYEIGG